MRKLGMKDLLVIVLGAFINLFVWHDRNPVGVAFFCAAYALIPGENAVGDGCPVRDGLCTTDDFFYKIYRIDNDGDGHGSCFEKNGGRPG